MTQVSLWILCTRNIGISYNKQGEAINFVNSSATTPSNSVAFALGKNGYIWNISYWPHDAKTHLNLSRTFPLNLACIIIAEYLLFFYSRRMQTGFFHAVRFSEKKQINKWIRTNSGKRYLGVHILEPLYIKSQKESRRQDSRKEVRKERSAVG